MDIKELRRRVHAANLALREHRLITLTWGNVSGVDRGAGLVVIKPSGVEYGELSPENMALVSLETGELVEGGLKPSSDTPTHLELYRRFPKIGGVAHTHSVHATAFAQAMEEIPCLGTTHADYFYGPVPVTRKMDAGEIASDYELNTGKVIAELWEGRQDAVMSVPAALVAQHGPFTWGKTPEKAVEVSLVLEVTAQMAAITRQISPGRGAIGQALLDRHFLRKHGANAYYGQG